MQAPDTEPSTSSRYKHVSFDATASAISVEFREAMESIEEAIATKLQSPRYKALALTASEEMFNWIGKAIRDDQIARNKAAQPPPPTP